MTKEANPNLMLIGGMSASGKSASLINLKDPEGVMYFNCESGKKPPFPCKFQQFIITNPIDVFHGFESAEKKPEVHTIVVDSLTFLMDMYISVYVLTAEDGRGAWQSYAQFFKNMMQNYVAKSTKNVIFLAHLKTVHNELDMVMETKVPIKGSTQDVGVEAFFSLVLSAKKMHLKNIEGYSSDLLNITEDDEINGFKYVFQTMLTKETVNERMRGPIGFWQRNETFIDNDVQLVIDRLNNYY
jgi:hypothetical protein